MMSLTLAPPKPQLDPTSQNVGSRTGIEAYRGINLPDYKDPYDAAGFQGSKYYGIATGDSISPWSRLAIEQQKRLAAQNNSSAKAQGQGMAAKTADALAQQGGLTSGARERAQEQAGKNILSMTQQNNQGAANAEAGIGVDDAKQRMAMLADATKQLTSMKTQSVSGQNQYNQNTTDTLNKAVAADQAAKAQVEAARESNSGLSAILIVSTSLLGSLSPSEAKASEALSQSSKFTRLKVAREAMGSKNALRGYCKFSEVITPKIEHSVVAKKVLLHTMVKPLANKGFVAKIWSTVFDIIGRIS